MQSTKNLAAVQQLIQQLQELLGDQLLAVCRYGVTHRLNHNNDKQALANVLVIVDQLEAKLLQTLQPVAKNWERKTRRLPIFLSLEEWHASTDIFALEHATVGQSYELLYGEDIFKNIILDRDALRLIGELETYRKLVFLRQRLLLFGDKPEALRPFMVSTFAEVLELLWGLLQLEPQKAKGYPEPHEPEALFPLLQNRYPALNAEVWLELYRLSCQSQKVEKNRLLPLYEAYLDQLQNLYRVFDKGLAAPSVAEPSISMA